MATLDWMNSGVLVLRDGQTEFSKTASTAMADVQLFALSKTSAPEGNGKSAQHHPVQVEGVFWPCQDDAVGAG